MIRKMVESSQLSKTLWSFRREFLVVGILSMVSNLLMLTPTIYMLQVFDRVMLSQNQLTLLMVSLITLFLFGVMAFTEWMRSILLVRTGVKLDMALSQQVFKSSFLSYLNPAETSPAKAFGDLTTLRQFMTGNGVFAFFDVPWIPIYLGVLFLLHPWLGIFAIGCALIQGGIAVLGHQQSKKDQNQANEAQAEAQNYLQSKLRNVEVLSAMGMLDNLYRRWRHKQLKALTQSGDALHQSSMVMAVSKFVRYMQQTLSLALGAWLAIRGELSVGAMVASNVMISRALAPIDLIVATWPMFLTTREAYQRLQKQLEFEHVGRDKVMTEAPLGNLKLDNLVVRVPGRDRPIIDGVSLTALPGTVTVVLGPSGSGKSTLARSILGIRPNFEGQILLDEQPILQWTRDSLGPYIGYLPQDIELFDGSIAENIARVGKVDSQKVIAAATAAGLHQMILRFPKGYDTPVGQGGSFLSGGQRQRVGLARSLYGNPMLVVLDEPNANLDDEGENALMQAVQALKDAGRTVVLISHRPSVIKVADRLVIMQDGKLTANGPRDAVLQALQQQRDAQQKQAAAPLATATVSAV